MTTALDSMVLIDLFQQEPGWAPRAATAIVPDLLMGAHALDRADALLTRDRGSYRRYFKGLQIIKP